MPGLGNGGLGRLAACFIDSMATMQIPAMGYGLRYHYGIFRQEIQQRLSGRTPRQLAAPSRPLGGGAASGKPSRSASMPRPVWKMASRRLIANHPSALLGIPFDRPVVGYGGKTINTLRLWEAGTPNVFDFGEFSSGDFVGAVHQRSGRER